MWPHAGNYLLNLIHVDSHLGHCQTQYSCFDLNVHPVLAKLIIRSIDFPPNCERHYVGLYRASENQSVCLS